MLNIDELSVVKNSLEKREKELQRYYASNTKTKTMEYILSGQEELQVTKSALNKINKEIEARKE